MDNELPPIIPTQIQESDPAKPNVLIGIIVLLLIVVGGMGYYIFEYKKETINTPSPTPNLENTFEYTFYDPNLPFSIHYPKDYCWTQDIGAVVIHDSSSPCGGNNSINTKDNYLMIVAFPEFDVSTTKEYLASAKFEGTRSTGKKRMIGGYEAIQIEDPDDPNHDTAWVFLTKYEMKDSGYQSDIPLPENRYGVVIQSKLPDDPIGKAAEELILSTFTFNDAKSDKKINSSNTTPMQSEMKNSIQIIGAGMEPNVSDGEVWLLDKSAKTIQTIAHGDVVLFKYPLDPTDLFVKRIIGLPGEEVEIREGIVYLNGVALNEPYLAPATKTNGDIQKIKVPNGNYFVLGDNRPHSSDSRFWGFLPQENIVGKLVSCISACSN